ncbi:AAA family ATPase [Candidatus Bathyarchaeota archaeon]|nr:AAA family ATPase [Candidatus Bathyarchaeota archaeon]
MDRVKTGIHGLDELLGGGLPKGRVTLIIGTPGSGKTVLCAQFLLKGARDYGENGIYVSLDESRDQFMEEMASFRWDFEKLEKTRCFSFIDASPIRKIQGPVTVGKLTLGKRDFSLLSLIEGIRSNVKAVGAERVALDPLASLIFQYPDPAERRTAILDLIEALIHTGATCLITSELKMTGPRRILQEEEYLAHGVILMTTLKVGKSTVRIMEIEKMRGISIDDQPRPYKITPNGIEVFPYESVF